MGECSLGPRRYCWFNDPVGVKIISGAYPPFIHRLQARACSLAGQTVNLRMFHPALVAFIMRGDVTSVMAIDSEIAAFGR